MCLCQTTEGRWRSFWLRPNTTLFRGWWMNARPPCRYGAVDAIRCSLFNVPVYLGQLWRAGFSLMVSVRTVLIVRCLLELGLLMTEAQLGSIFAAPLTLADLCRLIYNRFNMLNWRHTRNSGCQLVSRPVLSSWPDLHTIRLLTEGWLEQIGKVCVGRGRVQTWLRCP